MYLSYAVRSQVCILNSANSLLRVRHSRMESDISRYCTPNLTVNAENWGTVSFIILVRSFTNTFSWSHDNDTDWQVGITAPVIHGLQCNVIYELAGPH